MVLKQKEKTPLFIKKTKVKFLSCKFSNLLSQQNPHETNLSLSSADHSCSSSISPVTIETLAHRGINELHHHHHHHQQQSSQKPDAILQRLPSKPTPFSTYQSSFSGGAHSLQLKPSNIQHLTYSSGQRRDSQRFHSSEESFQAVNTIPSRLYHHRFIPIAPSPSNHHQALQILSNVQQSQSIVHCTQNSFTMAHLYFNQNFNRMMNAHNFHHISRSFDNLHNFNRIKKTTLNGFSESSQ